jgi:allantoin racemase
MTRLLHVITVDAARERLERVKALLQGLASPATEVEVMTLPGGPSDLEHYEHEHEAIVLMMERVPVAVREKVIDAVTIGCFYDPGVRALRERLGIPVVGVGEASMHLASLLGHRFSVLVGRKKWIPLMSDNALAYGFERRIASWRSIEFTVAQLQADPEGAFQAMVTQAEIAVRDDRAEVVVLGCASMERAAQRLSERIGVPVVDPVVAGFKLAEMLGDLRRRTGLSISRRYDYEPAPQQEGPLVGEHPL